MMLWPSCQFWNLVESSNCLKDMTFKVFLIQSAHAPGGIMTLWSRQNRLQSSRAFITVIYRGPSTKQEIAKRSFLIFDKKKVVPKFDIFGQKWP